MRVAVIVVAAGSGSRLGHVLPKAFVPVAGRPLLSHAVEQARRVAEQVVVVVPDGWQRPVAELAPGVDVVVGGATRQASVGCALAVLRPGITTVLVHDAARPLTPSGVFDRVLDALATGASGVVPILPIADTIRALQGDPVAGGALGDVVERTRIVATQTPQGFPRTVLASAYATATTEYTDDAAVVAAAGHSIVHVPGDQAAFKVTVPADLDRAERALSPSIAEPFAWRVGTGVDVHAFASDASVPLWLAGLHWPGERGLVGHSDGDVASHAICDALLAAAGLGDLGQLVGVDAPDMRGVSGVTLIAATVTRLRATGATVGNVSVQVLGARPRLAPRRAEAEAALGAVVGAPVSVSASTTDGLGFVGRAEGLAAIATALVRPGPGPATRSY